MTDRPTDADHTESGVCWCEADVTPPGPTTDDDLPDESDDWTTDVGATIHRLIGDDGDNDDTNDWVHDIANALWTDVGSRDAARIRRLEAQRDEGWAKYQDGKYEIARLTALGSALADAYRARDRFPNEPGDAYRRHLRGPLDAWDNR